jgi:hypothetical protein
MPNKVYVHTCSDGKEIRRGGEICRDCGKRCEYDGWGYSMVERMCHYSGRTGLPPIGPHRALADKLINPRFMPCPQCDGKGLIDINHGESYEHCPKCAGTMYVFDGTPAELAALRQQVMDGTKTSLSGPNASGAEAGYTGGGFIRLVDNTPQAIDAAANAMARALGIQKSEPDQGEETPPKS